MKFKCDCCTHVIKIEDFSGKTWKGLSFQIYDIYSQSGRKYKKPKLISDVVIMNNHYPKEYDKVIEFIKKHGKKNRRKN